MLTIAKKLRRLRLLADKKQSEIADILGISQQEYSKFERDKPPKIKYLKRLSEFYQVSVDEIIDDVKTQSEDLSGLFIGLDEPITERERKLYERLIESKENQINMMKEISDLKLQGGNKHSPTNK